jgi:YjbE family integral membrane protein
VDWVQLAGSAVFWKSLFEIIVVNIILSGDNAVVIALAARNLPQRQQKKAIFYGSAAAIVLRVVLTVFAVQLLQYPYLKMAGAVLLIWIGAKLLVPEGDEEDGVQASGSLWAAIRTILIADLVMSLDNVIAVAAAAETGPKEARVLLLIIGLGLSIPLIIVGSQLLLKLMGRWPVIITLGAALLGFVAGEMAVTDPAIEAPFHEHFGHIDYIVSAACAVLVVAIGLAWAKRVESRRAGAHEPAGSGREGA